MKNITAKAEELVEEKLKEAIEDAGILSSPESDS